MALKQGTIAWAELVMPNGSKKRRPVVIITPTDRISSADKILVVGISASYRPDDPNVIPLMWRSDGNIYTGLKKPCAITLIMRGEMAPADLTATDKWIGNTALVELLERLKSQ